MLQKFTGFRAQDTYFGIFWNIVLMAGFFNRQGTKRIETFVISRVATSLETVQLKDDSANSFWGNNRCLFREVEETN